MRCHNAPLVWADRCLPLSSTRRKSQKKEVNNWTSHRCFISVSDESTASPKSRCVSEHLNQATINLVL